MLAKMQLPFLLGGAICLGSGQQPLHWVSLEDVVGAITHALYTEKLCGGVTLVAPERCTNEGFTKAMTQVLFRPYWGFKLPAWALRGLAGAEFADDVLLNERVQEALPTELTASGFTFAFPALVPALRFHLGVDSALESLLAII
jgi:NAD dependent epimerase/dehydratase family enzyme